VAATLHFIRTETSDVDEYATRAMGEAFDAACAELHDNNLSELVREIIAERIIEAAKRGERNSQRLCGYAIAAMNGERNQTIARRWGRYSSVDGRVALPSTL
jgi:hypothetical protein